MKTFYEHEVDKKSVITQAEVSRMLHWCQYLLRIDHDNLETVDTKFDI